MVMICVMLLGDAGHGYLASRSQKRSPSGQFTWPDFLQGLISPFKNSDFTWVFMTRMLVTMGIFTVQEFLQYYLGDVIGVANFVLPGHRARWRIRLSRRSRFS